jgi:hypothetical protein
LRAGDGIRDAGIAPVSVGDGLAVAGIGWMRVGGDLLNTSVGRLIAEIQCGYSDAAAQVRAEIRR